VKVCIQCRTTKKDSANFCEMCSRELVGLVRCSACGDSYDPWKSKCPKCNTKNPAQVVLNKGSWVVTLVMGENGLEVCLREKMVTEKGFLPEAEGKVATFISAAAATRWGETNLDSILGERLKSWEVRSSREIPEKDCMLIEA